VFQTCCVHDAKEWGLIFVGAVLVLFFLYFFLLGLNVLGSAAKVIGGCAAGALFDDDTNPVAGVMIGIICTVLIQSSSSTTSIIVSLVGAGLFGVRLGIFMVMGANIGTSVTNTIVAMGHLGDGDELERAFAGACVHDMFNFLSVAILFPIELITKLLFAISKAMVPDQVKDGDKWEGPVKKLVGPLGKQIIVANKKVTKTVAKGGKCEDFYPAKCEDGVISYDTCKGGLITCDKKAGCPAFFQDGATRKDDEVAGAVCFFMAICILVICLIGLVSVLQKMLMGTSTRIIYKATNVNGYLAILIGCGITILVQSSSITTSVLTPFVGIGALRIEQMFPLTLGANIGTTFTGLLSALVSDSVDSLQVALCHLFFNIFGILIWYPVPFMRAIPIKMAKALGKTTRIWRGFPIVYILVVFLLIPLALFGLSTLFQQGSKGYTVLGAFLVAILGALIIWFIYKWYYGGLKDKIINAFKDRQRRSTASKNLPEDMDYCKSEIERLREHTGLSAPEPEVEKEDNSSTEDA
jgi:sodium-dependent phosphate cotransporter